MRLALLHGLEVRGHPRPVGEQRRDAVRAHDFIRGEKPTEALTVGLQREAHPQNR